MSGVNQNLEVSQQRGLQRCAKIFGCGGARLSVSFNSDKSSVGSSFS